MRYGGLFETAESNGALRCFFYFPDVTFLSSSHVGASAGVTCCRHRWTCYITYALPTALRSPSRWPRQSKEAEQSLLVRSKNGQGKAHPPTGRFCAKRLALLCTVLYAERH